MRDRRQEEVCELGKTVYWWGIGVLPFADNTVVMAESEEGLQHNLQIVRGMLSKWELKGEKEVVSKKDHA